MKKDSVFHLSRLLSCFLLCLLLISLSASASGQQDDVIMFRFGENLYTEAAASFLPDYEADELKEGIFWYLEMGIVTEGYDFQARSALETHVAEYWYPHFLSTAVIAIDRDKTDVQLLTWGDLAELHEEVSFFEGDFDGSALLCAMSYGLEGENYSFKTATALLEALHSQGKLSFNSFDSPILICFDDQAARLIREGRNIEIIVPSEGTFAYEKGLLSPVPLTFSGDVAQALLTAGLRLTDGRCDAALYPDAEAYAPACALRDFDHFSTVSLNMVRDMRRDVRHVRLYTGADGREHQFLALVYIAVIAFWTASVIRRAMQRSVPRGALATCAIMLAWITVRLVKYQTSSLIYWDRFLWFSFLGFQLMLMFTLLVMAWSIDQPESRRIPRWLWALGAVNLSLALLVLSNDAHNLVYIIDFNNPFWRSDYTYGAGFYIATALYAVQFIAANGMLLVKGIRSPNNKAFVFPLALCVLIIAYHWGYVSRVPLMHESDMTMMAGIFALLFFESAIRSGMIPVNTKYTQVFASSTLRMQILDPKGAVAIASSSAFPLDARARDYVLSGAAQPLMQDENTLLYGGALAGGYVAWQEDVSGLNHLHRETEESVCRLKAANALLAEEEKVKRSLDEEAESLRLMEQLEAEIAEKTALLTRMINALDAKENQGVETVRIALLLCYIKRRCNLFFRERETESLPADELTMYADELAELSGHAKLNIAALSRFGGDLPVRQATLFYDFFYEIIDWAAECGCTTLLRHMGREGGFAVMRLMPSADVRDYSMAAGLQSAIEAAGGKVSLKDLGDAAGISLVFPEASTLVRGAAGAPEGGEGDA